MFYFSLISFFNYKQPKVKLKKIQIFINLRQRCKKNLKIQQKITQKKS